MTLETEWEAWIVPSRNDLSLSMAIATVHLGTVPM
jgi:hypothetical protein